MNRREFSKIMALGTTAAATGIVPLASASSVTKFDNVSRSERKEWAKEYFKGLGNSFMLSYTPDFRDIDEEGIRHDVRQSIKHGLFSMFGVGNNTPQGRRVLQIVSEEARGKILIGTGAGFGESMQSTIEWLQHAETMGASHVFVGLPRDAKTEDEMYRHVAQIAEATNMGVVLYAVDGEEYRKFHPSNVPFAVFDRLADIPNVIGMKVMTTLDDAVTYELFQRLGKRILLGHVDFTRAPLLAGYLGMQWSGHWTIEALQSPEKPYAVDFMNLMLKGEMEKAMKVYWHMLPATRTLFDLMRPLLPIGIHPWHHLKYYMWCVGGNGGMMKQESRDPEYDKHFILTGKHREAIKKAYRAMGITPSENDEEFIVGRAAYARGVRPTGSNPFFTA